MPTPIKVQCTVADVLAHTVDVRTFVLATDRPAPAFRPGQFLHLALDPYDQASFWPESRVFSIASSPSQRSRLRITVARKGLFTGRMFYEIAVGKRLWIKLPYGSFCPARSGTEPLVLLAGGTGITPFVSFIEWLAEAPETGAGEVHLHYAARNPELLVYRDVFEACIARLSCLRLTCYVEQAGDVPGGGIRVGRISIDDVCEDLKDPSLARYYLSGPRAMIDVFLPALIDRGADAARVITDDWGTS